jgi:hypothetical protein
VIIRVAFATLLLVVGAIAWTLHRTRELLVAIPLPTEAQLVSSEYELAGLRRVVSFSYSEDYPGNSVRNFYADWANRRRWHLLSEREDPWSTDRWQSFTEEQQGAVYAVDQWLARWRSPDARWDLRLILTYRRPAAALERPGTQTGYLIASRVGL